MWLKIHRYGFKKYPSVHAFCLFEVEPLVCFFLSSKGCLMFKGAEEFYKAHSKGAVIVRD